MAIASKEFKTLLNAICYNIGVKDPLDDQDLDKVFLFLSRHFANLTLQDINDGFELYAAQELEFKTSHFNSFDNVFISKVLKSYEQFKRAKHIKPKILTIDQPQEDPTEEEKKSFEWVKFNFLDSSPRNGRAKTFPDIMVSNWKEAYLYMIKNHLLIELTGLKLTARIKQAEAIMKSESTNKRKSFANSISSAAQSKDKKPMLYFKLEVTDWFKKNKESLV